MGYFYDRIDKRNCSTSCKIRPDTRYDSCVGMTPSIALTRSTMNGPSSYTADCCRVL
jgi:hypothetical protein